MDLQKVKAVLFDLDGTLLDTVNDIGTCVNDVMCRYGYPTHEIAEYRDMVGHGAKQLVRDALPTGTSEEVVERLFQEYVLHYRSHCARFTGYFPGVREFLSFLQEQGYLLGVITNKTQPTAEKIIGTFLGDVPFSLLWGNNGQRPLKPSTESALLACEELQVVPDQVLFVGDGDTDMEFASNAGFLSCGVTWGYRDAKTLMECGADFLVDSFSQLQEKF